MQGNHVCLWRLVRAGLLFVTFFLSISAKAVIAGYIDKVVTEGGNVAINGWACDKGLSKSINVHVYLGDANNKNKVFIGAATANQSNEKAVNDACSTSGSKHRYKVLFSKKSLMNYRNKYVYVYGISEKDPNLALNKSGQLQIPNFWVAASWIPRNSLNDLIIPKGMTAYIDTNITASLIDIQGTLICQSDKTRTIKSKGILISGRLRCGESSKRVTGKFTFTFMKGRSLSMMGHSMGERTFAVTDGGKLEMFGATGSSKWTRLSETANAGAKTIKLKDSVGWQAGDEIVIASTSYDLNETEKRKISKRVSGTQFELDKALTYTHYGKNHNYSKGSTSWKLLSSAEVGNLTRKIVITTADLSSSGADQYMGAHMMVMRGGKAYIDGAEFYKMGQAGEMARYPFHWHLAKDVSGQYIKNSSIHDSFQRCITVHGTTHSKVVNNVCYNHRGHGIFLEDGNERFNTIKKNLVMLSRKPYPGRELLESDFRGGQSRRFQPTSGYWIAHPQNIIAENVSVGSEGTGFWMSFEQNEICDKIDGDACVTPAKGKTQQFDYNIAKTNRVGMTWDGARTTTPTGNPNNEDDMTISSSQYNPPEIPTFVGNQAMHGSQSCFYTRSSTMNFDQTITTDCGWHHFHAFNIRLNNSLMIGDSPFPRDSKAKRTIANSVGSSGHYGIVLYDGPFELNNVLFQNFSKSDQNYADSKNVQRNIASMPIGKIGGANKYTNRTKKLKFSPEPKRRVDFRSQTKGNWADWHVSQSILDQDGTLTGVSNSMLVVKNGFNKISGCTNKDSWNAVVCDAGSYKIGNLVIHDYSDVAKREGTQNKLYFNTIRNGSQDSHPSIYPNAGYELHSKVNLLVNTNQYYEVDLEGQNLNKKTIRYHTERGSEKSNIIRFINVARTNCSFSGARKVSNTTELNNHNGSAYLIKGSEIWFRFLPSAVDGKFTGTIKPRSISHDVNCT